MGNAKWTAGDLPDLTGRTAVVTGASSGIGFTAARELARAGASVVLAVRDVGKGQRAAATMPGTTQVRHLDLASLASVRAFAAGWHGDLDILINNAGVMATTTSERTLDGLEINMGINYLGAFALTNLLLRNITSRVVNVSSELHRYGHVRCADLNREHGRKRELIPLQAYCDSKLAMVLFGAELQRLLDAAGSPVRAITAHPGIARTHLADHVGGIVGWTTALAMPFANDAVRGAYPALFAATQDIPGASYVGPDGLGHFRGYPQVQLPARRARGNAPLAHHLWNVSARLTGTDFPHR